MNYSFQSCSFWLLCLFTHLLSITYFRWMCCSLWSSERVRTVKQQESAGCCSRRAAPGDSSPHSTGTCLPEGLPVRLTDWLSTFLWLIACLSLQGSGPVGAGRWHHDGHGCEWPFMRLQAADREHSHTGRSDVCAQLFSIGDTQQAQNWKRIWSII